jgi:mRNA-degrading endonuclease RelE of RelBE toxin-antitoxin system
MKYSVEFTNRAEKDAATCLRAGYGKRLKDITETVERDPTNIPKALNG